MNTEQQVFYRKWGQLIGLISFLIIAVAAGALVGNGWTDIRYTSDHQGTISIWSIWVPAFVGIILIRIIPFHLSVYNPIGYLTKQQLTTQSIIFLSGAILFPVTLLLVDDKSSTFQLWYIGLKLALLLLLPWLVVRIFQSQSMNDTLTERPQTLTRWMGFSPLLIVGVWIYLSYFSVFSAPHTSSKIADPMSMIIMLCSSFLINSVLEELFYRVWLQTRLERWLGTWPAILLTSILWAIWHIAIQSTGQWSTDVVTVISNQGIIGIFLGYLWSRYRNVWAIILIHGILNAPPYLLLDLWRM
jgi:uncharacterized protein